MNKNQQIVESFSNLKHDLLKQSHIPESITSKINEFETLLLSNQKKTRAKHSVPSSERCMAKKNGGEQCSRRRLGDNCFCGTHIKGIPHGQIKDKTTLLKKVTTYPKDINGITYFCDDKNNVYSTQDVYENKLNPKIIGKYITDNGISIIRPIN